MCLILLPLKKVAGANSISLGVAGPSFGSPQHPHPGAEREVGVSQGRCVRVCVHMHACTELTAASRVLGNPGRWLLPISCWLGVRGSLH